MKSIEVSFKNKEGNHLSGVLEMPLDGKPLAYAVFAHCFTCNKNFSAVKNICKTLTGKSIAVLRFDFTGLGHSEGDFADTNFSSTVDDLLSALTYVKEKFSSPRLLIGHSLGGAAVLLAAGKFPDVKAVAVVGAPAKPEHVQHLLQGSIDEINTKGQIEVSIGGRPFKIKKQFIDDLRGSDSKNYINKINAALLILHSPQDMIVSIDNAAEIYGLAKHPKSFVTLDGADHLLTNKEDSIYAGEVIATWATRYLPKTEGEHIDAQVIANTGEAYYTVLKSGVHQLMADEPESVGGSDYGPSPYDYLSMALGACTGMTLRMYANHKKWDLKSIEVRLNHHKVYQDDCEDCEQPSKKIDKIDRVITLEGDLNDIQKARLLEIADKCPVHKTLHQGVIVNSSLKK